MPNQYEIKQSPIMKFFEYEHLPLKLQPICEEVAFLARKMDKLLPAGAEKGTGLRKLLEAKDCFVRANYLRNCDND